MKRMWQVRVTESQSNKTILNDSDQTDEEPDVDDIEVDCQDNPANCVNDNISKVLEVYDEETCLETMKGMCVLSLQ